MKPREGSAASRRTRRRSPTSSPSSPRTSFPSAGGSESLTNVLSLDALRAVGAGGEALSELTAEAGRLAAEVRDARLAGAARFALRSLEHAAAWLKEAGGKGQVFVEAGGRRFALTLGRSFALALLARHAQWALDTEGDSRASAAARRFAQAGVDLIADADPEDAAALMEDG